jgi:HxlR-like helix-turn-helix protein
MLEPEAPDGAQILRHVPMSKDVLELPLDVTATRPILEHIAAKWTVLILSVLCTQPARFNDLKRRLDGITHKALSEALKRLSATALSVAKSCRGSRSASSTRLPLLAARYANPLPPFTTGRSPTALRWKQRSVPMTHREGTEGWSRRFSNQRAVRHSPGNIGDVQFAEAAERARLRLPCLVVWDRQRSPCSSGRNRSDRRGGYAPRGRRRCSRLA